MQVSDPFGLLLACRQRRESQFLCYVRLPGWCDAVCCDGSLLHWMASAPLLKIMTVYVRVWFWAHCSVPWIHFCIIIAIPYSIINLKVRCCKSSNSVLIFSKLFWQFLSSLHFQVNWESACHFLPKILLRFLLGLCCVNISFGENWDFP